MLVNILVLFCHIVLVSGQEEVCRLLDLYIHITDKIADTIVHSCPNVSTLVFDFCLDYEQILLILAETDTDESPCYLPRLAVISICEDAEFTLTGSSECEKVQVARPTLQITWSDGSHGKPEFQKNLPLPPDI